LNDIKFSELDKPGKPYIFHNAFNFKGNSVDQFANNAPPLGRKGRKAITAQSLCACSALPFIEETVKVEGEDYCEGALVDTLNFYDLLNEHGDLEEIWVNRIVDVRQIRKPKNQHDALANLCQMFAATVGEDDFKLFKFHVRENNRLQKHPQWEGIIVDIPVDDEVNFEWALPNLRKGRSGGYSAADAVYKLYEKYKDDEKLRKEKDGVLAIPHDLSTDQIKDAGLSASQLALVLRSLGRK
jgi:predicted acylesterase/phospholipase RssA